MKRVLYTLFLQVSSLRFHGSIGPTQQNELRSKNGGIKGTLQSRMLIIHIFLVYNRCLEYTTVVHIVDIYKSKQYLKITSRAIAN